MNNLFKYLFIISLISGIILFSINETKILGLILLFIFQPSFLLFYITFFNWKIGEENLTIKFRTPFIVSMLLTIIFEILHSTLQVMHWPGFNLLKFLTFTFGLLTCLLAIIYLFVNRKNLRSRLVYELIIFMIPILTLFMSYFFMNSVNKQDYLKALNEKYISLNRISIKLQEKNIDNFTKTDSLINYIDIKKQHLIQESGGMDSDKIVKGGLNTAIPRIYLQTSKPFQKIFNSELIDEKLKQQLRESQTVYNCLNTLTEIQIELLLK